MAFAQFLKTTFFTLFISNALLMNAHAIAAEHIAPQAYSTIENTDLNRLLPNDEIKPILAGETEFLSLYSEYMSADFRGIVVLIPDWQSAPTNNAGMNFLRKELNNLGYTTYAMTVPDINWRATKSTTTTSAQAADLSATAQPESVDAKKDAEPHHVDAIEKVTNEVIDNYKTNLITRYEALYQTAMEEPNNIVIIAQGTSAGVLLEYYAEFPDSRIDAFISLSSYLPNTKRNKNLSQTTSLVTPALLDIYYASDNNEILMNLKRRQRWVNRNAKFDYRQRELFGIRNQPEQHLRLTKEIDGFLRRLF